MLLVVELPRSVEREKEKNVKYSSGYISYYKMRLEGGISLLLVWGGLKVKTDLEISKKDG